MLISELIKKLETELEDNGDLSVTVKDGWGQDCHIVALDVESWGCKDNGSDTLCIRIDTNEGE